MKFNQKFRAEVLTIKKSLGFKQKLLQDDVNSFQITASYFFAKEGKHKQDSFLHDTQTSTERRSFDLVFSLFFFN